MATLEQFTLTPYNLVMLDLTMPGLSRLDVLDKLISLDLSGEALFDALKQQDPHVKIIVVTGYPLDNKNRQLLEKKVVDWLQKPFTADQVLEAVSHVLEVKQSLE